MDQGASTGENPVSDHKPTGLTLRPSGKRRTDLISAIVNRKMSVQIIPKMSLRFPSMISCIGKYEHGVAKGICGWFQTYLLVRYW